MRKVENAHVALWLMKDVSWCRSWTGLGLLMVGPTLALAIYICWKGRKETGELVHNAAVCLWICANITWMIGEFYFNDGTRRYTTGFFYCGMAILAGYYLRSLWGFVQRRGREPLKLFT